MLNYLVYSAKELPFMKFYFCAMALVTVIWFILYKAANHICDMDGKKRYNNIFHYMFYNENDQWSSAINVCSYFVLCTNLVRVIFTMIYGVSA